MDTSFFLAKTLKHRRWLPVGYRLRSGMQRWIATIERRAGQVRVLEHRLRILQRREPHSQVLQLDAGSLAALILRGAGAVRIHGESNQRDRLEADFTRAIGTRVQISHVLGIAKRFGRVLDKENGKGDIRWHIEHINGSRVEKADL